MNLIKCAFHDETFYVDLPSKDVIANNYIDATNRQQGHSFTFAPYFVVYVTDFCNMNCPYCFNKIGDIKRNNRYPTYSLDELISFFTSLECSDIYIRFFGGEPLMNKGWIIECVNRLNETKINFHYNIFTNLVLLDKKFIDFAQKNKFQFFISLGGDDQADPYKAKIYRNIIKEKSFLLRKCTDDVIGSIVWDPDNERSFLDILKDYKDIGLKYIHFNITWGKSMGDSMHSRLIYELERFAEFYVKLFLEHEVWHLFTHPFIDYIEKIMIEKPGYASACEAGNYLVAIASDGTLYPCHCFTPHSGFEAGSVQKREWNKRFENIDVDKIEPCKTCDIRYICKAKCYANNYIVNKDIKIAVTERCFIEKKIFSCCAFIVKKIKEHPTEYGILKKIIDMRPKENVNH